MNYQAQIQRGLDYLIAAQDSSGGWGYRTGGMAFVEPTALAIAALRKVSAANVASGAIQRSQSWLTQTQHADGGWGVCAIDDESTWATAYGVYALSLIADTTVAGDTTARRPALEIGLSRLLRPLPRCGDSSSQLLPESKGSDASVIGWPWSEGECFWVFPTAIAMLAAIAAGRGDSPRIGEGTAYLIDRACQDGGWNFGNPYMLDKALWPAAVETAAALLALRASGAIAPVVAEGMSRLRTMIEAAATPLSLAWGLLASETPDPGNEAARSRLAAQQAEDGGWRANPWVTALAVLALAEKTLL